MVSADTDAFVSTATHPRGSDRAGVANEFSPLQWVP